MVHVSLHLHIVTSVITLLLLGFVLRMVRRQQLRAKYALLWLPIGGGMALMAIWPRSLQAVSQLIGISYPPATLFLVAIVLLLLIAIHFSWELSRLEERTRVLAEVLALQGMAEHAAILRGEPSELADAARAGRSEIDPLARLAQPSRDPERVS